MDRSSRFETARCRLAPLSESFRAALPRRLSALLSLVLLSAFTVPAAASPPPVLDQPSSLVVPGVSLRPGVTMDVHVAVWGDTGSDACRFLVTGFLHAAPSWGPWVDALPGDACAFAVDLPGRAASSIPTGIPFYELTLEDHVTVVLETLDRLAVDHGLTASTLVGHSMGGVIVQRAQQRLLDQGSNLAERFGIEEVILLAPTPPAGLPYFLADSGAAGAVLSVFLVTDPDLGPVVSIPTAFWPQLFFANFAGDLAPKTPTPQALDALGAAGFAEPLFVALQLTGSGGFERLAVSAGAFAGDGPVRLRLVAYDQDTLVLASESAVLYRHLTGDDSLACFEAVPGTYAVHDLHLSSPARVVAAIQSLEACDP